MLIVSASAGLFWNWFYLNWIVTFVYSKFCYIITASLINLSVSELQSKVQTFIFELHCGMPSELSQISKTLWKYLLRWDRFLWYLVPSQLMCLQILIFYLLIIFFFLLKLSYIWTVQCLYASGNIYNRRMKEWTTLKFKLRIAMNELKVNLLINLYLLILF